MNFNRLQNLYLYNKKSYIKFHMPGNYGGKNLKKNFRRYLPFFETTEVHGTDDYHNPQGIIKKAEKATAKLFNSNHCIYLVNGSSGGIIAAISYLFREGDQILVLRDCHKSVIYGLILSGAKPVFPESLVVSPLNYEEIEQVIKKNERIKGIILTTPNYYGIGNKDLKLIAQLCNKYKIKLLVDEAHGSHLYFTDLRVYLANTCKADLVVNSTHKNLTGLTQTGVININAKDINCSELRKHISLITSTSPSYILLASIAYCTEQYTQIGEKILQETIKKADYLKEFLDKYKIRYITEKDLEKNQYLDPTKITLLYRDNKKAEEVFKGLINNGIIPEFLADNKILLFINHRIRKRELVKTAAILKKFWTGEENILYRQINDFKINNNGVLTPREAFYSQKEKILLNKAIGKVAVQPITPYPPGIPILFPGEVVTEEIIQYLNNSNFSSIHGIENGMIEVVKE
ncbi:aminotransferase class I/II-fold pyridoxal phosphate-dependent enzyme [Anaerobranca gottschalkii]|uniref:Lysine decarboxylase n=1 Tax=Anaerobranca gottschalkii DSM 13577 TaxID=1120990 RepID=A0A1I0BEW6_9FIRM|nr:aminotransferase class I/II-fold pyridoxal phosphate-dependent enzyme [Anaerobranca gottschalkii]SET05051.1 lysine decarboxylase [Anaerobranca gottschalkii DSM 13577]